MWTFFQFRRTNWNAQWEEIRERERERERERKREREREREGISVCFERDWERQRNVCVCLCMCVVRAINEDISFIFVFRVARHKEKCFYQRFSKQKLKKEIFPFQEFLTSKKKEEPVKNCLYQVLFAVNNRFCVSKRLLRGKWCFSSLTDHRKKLLCKTVCVESG